MANELWNPYFRGMRLFKTVLFLLLLAASARSQTSVQLNSSEIKLALNKLNVLGSVLYVGAHPDDENTRLLSWLAKEKLYRTAYLSLTRGDGGQNLIGSEQAEQLGLIRTQELLAARRTDGAEQFFTRANDFGFSKTAEETLKIWDRRHILADVVWTIRKFRPDVIITRFTADARAGHGHHQASSILAQEAFDAAADPKQFPEQLRYVQPWQAKCILLNGFGGATTGDNKMTVDISAYNRLLGKGYGEIAAESRSNHKSQGFGSAKQRGQASESFSLWKGTMPSGSLFSGIETSWKRIPGGEKALTLAQQLNKAFDPENPQLTVPSLISLLTEVEALKDAYWKEVKSKELKELILACSGLWFEAYAAEPVYATGDSIRVSTQFVNRSDVPVKLVAMSAGKIPSPLILAANIPVSAQATLFAEKISQPYYLVRDHPQGEYINEDQLLTGLPENNDQPAILYTFNIAGKDILYRRPVVYKYTDQVRGEIYDQLVIAPPAIQSPVKKVILFADEQSQELGMRLKSFRANTSGTLRLNLPKGWTAQPATMNFSFRNKNEEQRFTFKISSSAGAVSGLAAGIVTIDGKEYSKDISTISYEHIPRITWFPSAEIKLVKLDLKSAGKNLAYIPGAGDLVPDMLKQIGYRVTTLTSEQVPATDLSVFDAVITGVRAYNVDPGMKTIQPLLLDYVKNGGTLLVQYNVNQPLVLTDIGPYPFTISRDRVTEEDARVTLALPDDASLNYPNKITSKDFDGWIQERGIYFATGIDLHYQAPLAMADTGENLSPGSLLIAGYGKGKFVYTSLVFFRELPAGVPGAYRLFVNLLSKKP